jgi:hypothetical protein
VLVGGERTASRSIHEPSVSITSFAGMLPMMWPAFGPQSSQYSKELCQAMDPSANSRGKNEVSGSTEHSLPTHSWSSIGFDSVCRPVLVPSAP